MNEYTARFGLLSAFCVVSCASERVTGVTVDATVETDSSVIDGGLLPPDSVGTDAGCAALQASALCGGRSGLTFAYQVLVDITRVEPGSEVLWDNGATFFMLRGDCRYWAQESVRNELREGVTTPEEVERRFNLPRLCGTRGVFRGASRDGATVRLAVPGATIDCLDGCSGGAVTPTLRQAADDAFAATRAFWEQATPVTGGYRLLAVSGVTPAPTTSAFAWPLSRSLSSVSVSIEQAVDLDVGSGHSITDPTEVSSLADLQRRFLALSEFQRGPYIRIAHMGVDHALWMRRMVPIEDDRGIVQVQALMASE